MHLQKFRSIKIKGFIQNFHRCHFHRILSTLHTHHPHLNPKTFSFFSWIFLIFSCWDLARHHIPVILEVFLTANTLPPLSTVFGLVWLSGIGQEPSSFSFSVETSGRQAQAIVFWLV
jgi:hypothetical protein